MLTSLCRPKCIKMCLFFVCVCVCVCVCVYVCMYVCQYVCFVNAPVFLCMHMLVYACSCQCVCGVCVPVCVCFRLRSRDIMCVCVLLAVWLYVCVLDQWTAKLCKHAMCLSCGGIEVNNLLSFGDIRAFVCCDACVLIACLLQVFLNVCAQIKPFYKKL